MMTKEERKDYAHESYKFRYKILKDEKRCVSCSKQDERTLNGFSRCEECAEKERAWHTNYYQKNKKPSQTRKPVQRKPRAKKKPSMTPEEKKADMHRRYIEMRDLLKSQCKCVHCKIQDERTLQGFWYCEKCATDAKVRTIKRKAVANENT